ncbi:PREDICTED: T-box transcription factor TBX5-like isoform X1 [Branchiostoma belcheri]|uniref:T-box transcription factor TBX5-like isoform X1 n=2 Tax=Branchiostoma belcheri TaxID=7741 RepID=A0A6P4XPM9_BRABE|nr:PREDICTED: T-box transcription factor TBX5-like isoform X1 [Branchiostoma belcheri]
MIPPRDQLRAHENSMPCDQRAVLRETQRQCMYQKATREQSGRMPTRPKVELEAENRKLWELFHQAGTEMIINTKGRCMFPTLSLNLSGLQPERKYYVLVKMILTDDSLYAYRNNQWVVVGRDAKPSVADSVYVHPKCPEYGAKLMERPLAFPALKLSSRVHDGKNMVQLRSMHKYQPVVQVVEAENMSDLAVAPSWQFSFPVTEFMAVSSYYSDKIRKLKVDNNKFAKNLRNLESVDRRERSQGQVPAVPRMVRPPAQKSPPPVTCVLPQTTCGNGVQTASPAADTHVSPKQGVVPLQPGVPSADQLSAYAAKVAQEPPLSVKIFNSFSVPHRRLHHRNKSHYAVYKHQVAFAPNPEGLLAISKHTTPSGVHNDVFPSSSASSASSTSSQRNFSLPGSIYSTAATRGVEQGPKRTQDSVLLPSTLVLPACSVGSDAVRFEPFSVPSCMLESGLTNVNTTAASTVRVSPEMFTATSSAAASTRPSVNVNPLVMRSKSQVREHPYTRVASRSSASVQPPVAHIAHQLNIPSNIPGQPCLSGLTANPAGRRQTSTTAAATHSGPFHQPEARMSHLSSDLLVNVNLQSLGQLVSRVQPRCIQQEMLGELYNPAEVEKLRASTTMQAPMACSTASLHPQQISDIPLTQSLQPTALAYMRHFQGVSAAFTPTSNDAIINPVAVRTKAQLKAYPTHMGYFPLPSGIVL